MSEYKVQINTSLCIGCGLCRSDCVGSDIELVNGKAHARGLSCIHCGHCEAICPVNAVTLTGYGDQVEAYEEQTRLDPEDLLNAIRTRRSVRQFTEEKIDQKIIDDILEAGRLAPTGGNGQSTSYVILNSKQDECEAVAVGIFSKAIQMGKIVISALKNMEMDEHFFFKKAPVVIVIFGKDKVSASLAAENMAFMAEAHGLGVLFSGFFTTCVNMSAKLRRIMDVPAKPKAVTTLVIGYPAVKYRRTVHRKPLNVKVL